MLGAAVRLAWPTIPPLRGGRRHQATIAAVSELYAELSSLSPGARSTLRRASAHGAALVALSDRVGAELAGGRGRTELAPPGGRSAAAVACWSLHLVPAGTDAPCWSS
ncbi:MAG: hypothetical protein R2705_20950 [Ilumatobacteraceae bacterium]